MAGSQDNALQQQPGPAQTPTRRQTTRKPMAQSQSPPGTAGGEAQSADVDFGQALGQQITQAIQPALDEFRQRMQELSDQMAATPMHGAGQSETGQEPPPPTRQGAAPQQREGEQARESQQQPALIPVRNVQRVKERVLADALPAAVRTVGRYSAQWLQSLLVAGLGALLAESARVAVQRRAEQSLHTLLQKAFEAAPADLANREILEKVEPTLQRILREALDAVFAEGVRVSVQQGGQQAIQQALRGDFGGAWRKVEETPQVMLTALMAVLRRHQQTILRLLLALVLLEVGSSLEHSAKAE